MECSAFHMNLSVDIAVDTVLLMQLFLGETVIEQTFKYCGSFNLSNASQIFSEPQPELRYSCILLGWIPNC